MYILDLPSFVLFVDSFVYIFNHSDYYAEKFRLALKKKLQLIPHNTHDLTQGLKRNYMFFNSCKSLVNASLASPNNIEVF